MIKFRFDVVSNVGVVRTNNEDMAYIFGAKIRDDERRSMVPVDSTTRFAAVIADGMGGYGGGEIASEMAVDSFDGFLLSLGENMEPLDVIIAAKQWVKDVNNQILTRGASNPELTNMGTTLTGIFTYNGESYLMNCGDSRVYRFRDGNLYQLSVDHSERERLQDYSLPSNLIYNALGIPNAFIDVTAMRSKWPMVDGDVYLVCSDGLSDMISDDDISEILENKGNAQSLVDAALAAGGRDNCTVILLQVSITDDEPEENLTANEKDGETQEMADRLSDVKDSIDTAGQESQENNKEPESEDVKLPPLPVVNDIPYMNLPDPSVSRSAEAVLPPAETPGATSIETREFYDEDGNRIILNEPPKFGSDGKLSRKTSLLQRFKNAVNAFRADPEEKK